MAHVRQTGLVWVRRGRTERGRGLCVCVFMVGVEITAIQLHHKVTFMALDTTLIFAGKLRVNTTPDLLVPVHSAHAHKVQVVV